MNGILDWTEFAYKFKGNPQASFETLAYHMFCREFHITKGLPAFYNQKHIETEPYTCEGGTVVGFQAKYYDTSSINSSQKNDLIKAVKGAANTYTGINRIDFYVSRPFSQSSAEGRTKTDFQQEIEAAAEEMGIEISWILPSQFEIILNQPEYADLMEYFFAAESTERVRKEISAVREMKEILLRQKWEHPSFRLLASGQQAPGAKADESLFPKGIRPSERFMVYRDEYDKESDPVQITEFIASSWENNTNRHMQIQGVGGIGKTVTLLSLATEDGYLPRSVPAVYIPMYELNDYAREDGIREYLENIFDKDTVEVIDELSKKPWNDGPNLMLLLDGFNEIALKEKQSLIWKEISQWSSRKGVQIITTSRSYIGSTKNRFTPITLQKLDENTIINYLESYNKEYNTSIAVPAKGDRLLSVLNIPLMLTLYIQVHEIEKSESNYPYLSFRSSTNAGTLISNYIQKEIYNYADYLKQSGDDDNSGSGEVNEFVFIMTAIVPYIMYEMEHDGLLAANEAYVREKIEQALQYFGTKPYCIPSQVRAVANWEYEDFDWPDAEGIFTQMIKKSCILVMNVGLDKVIRLRPMHQDFRDGLAALHLCNVGFGHLENKIALPEEFRTSQGFYVVGFMSDTLSEEETEKLWGMNRAYEPTNATATRLLLDIIGRQTGDDYTNVDFRGMDLSGISLYTYLNKGKFLFGGRKELSGAKISETTFLPHGHEKSVNSIVISPDGRKIVSASFERSVSVWDMENGACLQTLEGHTKWINALAMSKDGKRLASGSEDATVRIWDMKSGKCLHKLGGYCGSIKSLAISPDDRLVAAGTSSNLVCIWNMESGQKLYELEGHTGRVNVLAFSHDGKRLVSGSDDKTLRIWNTSEGKLLHQLPGHKGSIRTLTISEADDLVVSGSTDSTVRIWRMEDGTPIHKLAGHRNWVNALALSDDGKVLASGSSDNTIRIWDVPNGNCRELWKKQHSSYVTVLLMFANGKKLVSGSDDMTIRIWDVDKGKCLHLMEEHDGWINTLALSPDKSRLVSGSSDKTMHVWDMKSGACLYTIEGHIGGVRSMALSKDNRYLVSGSSDKLMRVWDMQSRKCVQTLKGHEGWVNTIVMNADGSRIMSGSSDGTIGIWNRDDGSCLHLLEGHKGWINSLELSEDGSVLASGSSDGTIRIWNPLTGGLMGLLKGHNGRVTTLTLSRNGKRLASGSDDNTIKIWNTKKGVCLYTLKGHARFIRTVKFGSSDVLLASGSADKTARIWHVIKRRCLYILSEHKNWVNTVAFSPNEKMLATGSSDGTIIIWNVNKGELGKWLKGHTHRVKKVLFSSDASFLVSTSNDGTVRIWDVKSGDCKYVLSGHTDRIKTLVMTSDDRFVMSGSYDGSVCIWDTACGDCVDVLEPFPSIDLVGIDLSEAEFSDQEFKLRCEQNGAIV